MISVVLLVTKWDYYCLLFRGYVCSLDLLSIGCAETVPRIFLETLSFTWKASCFPSFYFFTFLLVGFTAVILLPFLDLLIRRAYFRSIYCKPAINRTPFLRLLTTFLAYSKVKRVPIWHAVIFLLFPWINQQEYS